MSHKSLTGRSSRYFITYVAYWCILLATEWRFGDANQPEGNKHEVAHEQEPKLVCYYTNWAKDRPDPWSYVSMVFLLMLLFDRMGNTLVVTYDTLR